MINDLGESVLNKAHYKMSEPPVTINQGMDLARGRTFELLMLLESSFNFELSDFAIHLSSGFDFLRRTNLASKSQIHF